MIITYRLVAGTWQAVGHPAITPPSPPATGGGYGLSPYGTGPYGQ